MDLHLRHKDLSDINFVSYLFTYLFVCLYVFEAFICLFV